MLAVRRPRPRAWLQPLVRGRRELRTPPLAAKLVLRRDRVLDRARVLDHAHMTELVRMVAPPATFRSASFLRLTTILSRGRDVMAQTLAQAAAPAIRPAERAGSLKHAMRERLVYRTRTEAAAPMPKTAATPAAAAVQAPHLVRPPFVLRRDPPAHAERADDVTRVQPTTAGMNDVASEQVGVGAQTSGPSVDLIATQVLDRIERRAIAQRERMGRI